MQRNEMPSAEDLNIALNILVRLRNRKFQNWQQGGVQYLKEGDAGNLQALIHVCDALQRGQFDE